MQRREFITLLGGAVASWPHAGAAQQRNRVKHIGFLMNGNPNEESFRLLVNAFVQTLRKLGWRDRDNVEIHIRWSEADVERTRTYAMELVKLAPDIIVTSSSGNLAAVLRATRSIPVVFLEVSDPVAQGFVASLSHPGDNITGFSAFEFSVGGKWVDLLKKMWPSLARVAVMSDPDTAPQYALFLRSIQAAAPSLGVEIIPAPVHSATDIERAIDKLSLQPDSGLLLTPGSFTTLYRGFIVSLVGRHRLPTISASGSFVQNGGLMSYTVDYEPQFRQAAFYVDRFFKGTKLADLPVQTPTKFTFQINLKTAAALGIEVPLPILMSVDEVIE